MKVCYVILHYMNLEVTSECIENLIAHTSKESPIVVVDNASSNNSGEVLKGKYINTDRVTVILSEDNLGFAKGNNIGYRYAKEKFAPDVIVVMNNDAMITDDDFETKLSKYLENNDVDIIGPDIISRDGVHQNPMRDSCLSDKVIRKNMVSLRVRYILMHSKLVYKMYADIVSKRVTNRQAEKLSLDCNGSVPHGACILFNHKYVKSEENAFLPITFMFSEEDILFDYALKNGYKVGFCFDLKVNHMDDASTDLVLPNKREKLLFIYKHQIKSYKALLDNRKQLGL